MEPQERLEEAQRLAGTAFGTIHGAMVPKVICDHGEGIYLFDHTGKRYVDFSGGPHVVGIGHGNQYVREAMIRQMEKVSFFYRGFWLRAVERRAGQVAAVIGSSLLFGAIHFQLYDLPALAGFGAILALLTVRTGRLGPAIWAHVAFNITAVVGLLAQ